MNQITIEGCIVNQAKQITITSRGTEIPMTIFQICDTGIPSQKSDSKLYIEVHCLKDYINNIFNELIKNKHILVSGYLQQKKFRNDNGDQKSLYYITAENIKFLDKLNKVGGKNGIL